MQGVLQALGLFVATLLVAGFAGRRWWWMGSMLAILIVFTMLSSTSFWFSASVWLLFFATIVFNLANALRIKYITSHIFNWFKSVLPPLSRTEQEAIDAGDVWWEGELFKGRPNWKKLLRLPKATLSVEEQYFMDNQVEALCGMLNDWQIQQDKDLPPAVWEYLKKEGFFGLVAPKEWGGKGFSAIAHSTVVMKIATRSINAAVTVMVPNSLGPAELLLHYGTEEQKKHYLPRLTSGKEIPCFALTSTYAGSDAASMQDIGIICYGSHLGKQVLGIRLNWDKRYITLAPRATLIGLAFRLYDPEHLIGQEDEIGITVCLVPANHPGVETGMRHSPMNMAFLNGATRGKDVFIPMPWVIGGQDMCGHGWRMLMECLSIGRGISLPALGTSLGIHCFRTAGAYARIRNQFGIPIGRFEGIEEMLAFIGGATYLMNATRSLTATAVSLGVKPALASAITKYHVTEMGRKVVTASMDIHGGKAIQCGPKNYIAPAYEAVPVSITVEGANILTRTLMLFGQGAVRCHPFVQQEIATVHMAEKEQAIQKFDKLLLQHIGYALGNTARAFLYGLGGTFFYRAPVKGFTAYYYKQLTRMSTALALVSDFSMLFLGSKLKRKECLSARLGDVLSYLYLGSAALKYYADQEHHKDDRPFIEWSLQTCLYQIQIALDGFFANFPQPFIGKILKFIIFPFGRAYANPPQDKILQKIAMNMQTPSEFRDRLTHFCYQGKNPDDTMCEIERAFHKVIEIEEPLLRFKQAIKQHKIKNYVSLNKQLEQAVELVILTANEAQLIMEMDAAVQRVLTVDEFTEEELMNVKDDVVDIR